MHPLPLNINNACTKGVQKRSSAEATVAPVCHKAIRQEGAVYPSCLDFLFLLRQWQKKDRECVLQDCLKLNTLSIKTYYKISIPFVLLFLQKRRNQKSRPKGSHPLFGLVLLFRFSATVASALYRYS
jgi:hypothetical protein